MARRVVVVLWLLSSSYDEGYRCDTRGGREERGVVRHFVLMVAIARSLPHRSCLLSEISVCCTAIELVHVKSAQVDSESSAALISTATERVRAKFHSALQKPRACQLASSKTLGVLETRPSTVTPLVLEKPEPFGLYFERALSFAPGEALGLRHRCAFPKHRTS